ncbi:MFS family permease [Streptacidiphilus sp. MAP12-33]|uniref:MFS transporter n=1 Tax=Streptacidiphilus sp. MAP12-33 TaxID=3156266 RepID=UPI0035179670
MPIEQQSDSAAAPSPAPNAAESLAGTGPLARLGRSVRSALADITPLREHPDYRRLWFGQAVSGIGQQMTALAVSVQVYALTHSPFATGLIGLCSLLPLVSFGLYGGAVADRVDRRKLGLLGASGAAVLSVLLAVQALLSLHAVGLLYGVVALQAVCFAINAPARASMIPRLVPAEQLPAANALGSMSMNLGLTIGPMIGGLFIGLWGFQAAYIVDALAFGASLYAMWRLPAMKPEASPDGKRASVLDGLRFLRDRPNLRMTFLADIAAMVFGMPRALFPALAATVYGGGAGTVGLLTAAPAVGALAGGLFSGWVGRVHRHGLATSLAVAAWGFACAGFGLAHHLWLALALLACAGASDTVSMIFRNTMLQAAAPDDMRGRLQGVFIVVVAGGPRLGDFESGVVAQLTTPSISAATGGLACLATLALLLARYPSFLRYDSRTPSP